MKTEPITQGHAGATGRPTNGRIASATTPAPIAMTDVVETVSIPPLMAAFQPAWQAAANSTAAKTNGSILVVPGEPLRTPRWADSDPGVVPCYSDLLELHCARRQRLLMPEQQAPAHDAHALDHG